MRGPCEILLILGLIASAPAPAAGQGRPAMAFGRQDLSFDVLLPGVASTVSRLDGLNAGQFQLTGRQFAEVQITLTLPPEMTSASGAVIALQFGPADGGHSTDPDVATSQAFDPRVPLVTTLPNNGRMYVWLGGTALPAGQQPAGSYAATITVTMAYTGN